MLCCVFVGLLCFVFVWFIYLYDCNLFYQNIWIKYGVVLCYMYIYIVFIYLYIIFHMIYLYIIIQLILYTGFASMKLGTHTHTQNGPFVRPASPAR